MCGTWNRRDDVRKRTTFKEEAGKKLKLKKKIEQRNLIRSSSSMPFN
jgi:hypothetical protein